MPGQGQVSSLNRKYWPKRQRQCKCKAKYTPIERTKRVTWCDTFVSGSLPLAITLVKALESHEN